MTRTAAAPGAPAPRGPAGRVRIAPEALDAWRLFLRAHAEVTRRLEAELVAEQRLPLAEYDVLVQLREAPRRRLRMTELADRVVLSRSGLTRLVDRLERTGLVVRAPCPDDARGINCVLTEAGAQRLRDASQTHLAGVARHVTARLDDAELAQLAAVMKRLLGLGEQDDALTDLPGSGAACAGDGPGPVA